MESIRLSFEAVTPIFVLMMIGYLIKNIGLADKKNFDVINKLVFRIFLPIMLFYNIYSAKSVQVFDGKLILFTVAGVLGVFILGYGFVVLITKDNSKRGVILQSLFRANFAILGIPLVNYICGEGAGALSALMMAIIIPLFNILGVFALKRFADNDEKIHILSLLKGVITNPLIIGCLVGIAFFLLDIKLPVVIEKPVQDIAVMTSPLSIIVLGSEFAFGDMKGYAKDLIIAVFTRLVVVPLIVLSFAIWLGFSGEALACILVAFGAPVAISSFAMVQQMGGDEKLAAQIIVVSSGACLVTLFGWIFVLNYLHLF